ncbi:3'-5' exoribonuclease YhaM family protein [Qiania dongpingensis]|uniref:HD domain-containing protein n=1 Tax=Qiania dongpingensis TaxID=2763669 RepID=A0A7G9G1L0_9FIRM|nr:HD domain-containing protein [Qiania dongpingensis]QNM04692.1 HD domain-containing protein [Qiania dongpingensis]
MKYIETLREGERLSEIYLCKTKQVAKTKMGKTYYSLVLQDKTGVVDGKIWELSGGIDHFEALDYIKIDGDVTSFQGALQVNVRRVRMAAAGEYNPADYLPVSSKNIDQMYAELLRFVKSIENEKLRTLAERFFVEDKAFIQSFKGHSAAKTVHHGFVGGLLEHTLSVAQLCDFYCGHYPVLKRDLLIAAALFHDIGKTKELSDFPENDYTDDGQLLGHIVMGTLMVDEKLKTVPGFPHKTASELKHCILAHHGEYEYGSPKKPALAEAIALNFADNTDAKMQTMTELLAGNAGNHDWLGFNRLMDSNVRMSTEL